MPESGGCRSRRAAQLGCSGVIGKLGALAGAVDRLAAGIGVVAVLEGAAGTGKSRLLDVLAGTARASGIEARAAVAIELDRDLPLAVARRLLGGLVSAPEADGSAVSLSEGGIAAVHRLVGGAADRAATRPLLLCIDDLQWADAHTLRVVEALCGLTRELPLGVALSWRRAELDERHQQRLLAIDGVVSLGLEDLGGVDAELLVRGLLPDADEAFVEACVRVTGGNPFLLGELTAAVAFGGGAPDAVAAARILELEPATVRSAVLTRLGQMTPPAVALARGVAVLGDAAPLHQAARLAGLGPGEAAEAADRLVAVEILARSGAALSFRHPLLGAAVLADIGAFRRAQLFRAAADVVAADGAHERAGALLLRSTPGADPAAIAMLRAAAALALRSGDASAAVRLLHRALREPPAAADRVPLLVDIARAQAALGDPAALAHLDEALAGMERSSERARVLTEVARLHHIRSDFARAARLTERALSELADDDPAREWVLASWLMASGLDPERSAQTVAIKRQLADRALAGSPPAHPELQAIVALHLICTFADPGTVAVIAGDAVRGYAHESEDGLGMAVALALTALFYTGRLPELIEACGLALEVAAERSSILTAAAAAHWRGQARIELGDLQGALEDAETALLPYRYGWKALAANAAGVRAMALVELGDVEGARAALASDVPLSYPAYFHTRGLVELAGGAFEAARAAFDEAGRMLGVVWGVDSPAVVPWRSGAALAALGVGDREAAQKLSEDELSLAHRAAVPVALGRAARVRGVVIGGEQGIALLREACAILAGGDSVLEQLRAEVDLGAALRRAGARRESRELLERARDSATRLGLTALAERAASEHGASGGRPRRIAVDGVAGLTASELRIARLAAGGRTNREIAADLFLAPNGRVAPAPHLPQARRHEPARTRRGAQPGGGSVTCAAPSGRRASSTS